MLRSKKIHKNLNVQTEILSTYDVIIHIHMHIRININQKPSFHLGSLFTTEFRPVDLSVRVCMDKQLFKITPLEVDNRIDVNSPLSDSAIRVTGPTIRVTGSDIPSTPLIPKALISTTVNDSSVIGDDDMHIDVDDEIEGDVDVMCIDDDANIPNRSKRFRPACMPVFSQNPSPPSTQDILSRSEATQNVYHSIELNRNDENLEKSVVKPVKKKLVKFNPDLFLLEFDRELAASKQVS
jgi:hypothetical protein